MIEDLKYALLSIPNYDLHINYTERKDSIKSVYHDIVIEGFENHISVFYDPNERWVYKKLQYLNKENSIKKFQSVSAAMGYMKYLSKVTEDVRYELYHYFVLN